MKEGDYLEIRKRIKELRKTTLSLTQGEFSKEINISRSNLANIESGLINVTDRVINDICSKFSVSENWLRTGEGEMFEAKTRSEEIVIWAAKLAQKENSDFPKRFAAMLTNLNDEEWRTLEKMALMLLEENKKD